MTMRSSLFWRTCPRALLRLPNHGGKRLHLSRWRQLHISPSHRQLASSPEATRSELPQARAESHGRAKRVAYSNSNKSSLSREQLDRWELTVGIEIHAHLNTKSKLFSPAQSRYDGLPNEHVAFFDLAMPGSQPVFQKACLIPAIRAALALNCQVQNISRFDRKHYFHWDQPAGYQLTQYHQPLAKDGQIVLYAHDGIALQDGESITIGIQQVQMEQDTAKTLSLPGGQHLLDFNRAGAALVEIITLPQIHQPATAAALVRKIQANLQAANACTRGIEYGGLRADVNVSVRRNGSNRATDEPLGQRTEIKNLSSFKSVEDAIIAERDRQIMALEAGETIISETRGWSIGSTSTRPLRRKEGEVDYRYMPDPELGPVRISHELVQQLLQTMGPLPDTELEMLITDYGLNQKDALSLMALEDGGRAEYFRNVVDACLTRQGWFTDRRAAGKSCCSWVLHELGGLVSEDVTENPLGMDGDRHYVIPVDELAEIMYLLYTKEISMKTAKKVLATLFTDGDTFTTARQVVDALGLWYSPLTQDQYDELAREVADEKVIQHILAGKDGKRQFLVGQMMRKDTDGRIDALEARKAVDRMIETFRAR